MIKIGMDEAGKGDYFGYLVVAAVAADNVIEKKLHDMKIRDSKLVSDNEVKRLATLVKKVCKHDIVSISPKRYNELYKKKDNNLNDILAWAYKTAIENLLKKTNADIIIVDKFADEKVLEKKLPENVKKNLIQMVRGEREICVAAASILARDEFLRRLRALSRHIGYKLPKGASHIDEALKFLAENYDQKILSEIAKVHFKTTKKIMKK